MEKESNWSRATSGLCLSIAEENALWDAVVQAGKEPQQITRAEAEALWQRRRQRITRKTSRML